MCYITIYTNKLYGKYYMNTRERFHAVMNFESFDRLPIFEWASWWDKTIERWESEGLPTGMDKHETMRYFDLDIHYQDWIHPWSPNIPKPASHGAAIMHNLADYEKDIAPHMFHYPKVNNDYNVIDHKKWEKWSKEQESGNAVIWFTLNGFFWLPRTLFGIQEHLFAFYDQPELMKRINMENTEWILKVIDGICQYCTPDFMTFAEDMSYNNGPMIGKELFDEFMKPYYQIVMPELKKRGIKGIIDSDGDIHEAAFWFEDAGLDGILPLEHQAGVDMTRLRQEHPSQIYMGAFDKMVMNKGEQAMREEFERLLPIASQGGFIISCDHQTPPGVSLNDYKLYLKLFREYAALRQL
jgi:Uroporphyrinogen decarboxylase (URO-D)